MLLSPVSLYKSSYYSRTAHFVQMTMETDTLCTLSSIVLTSSGEDRCMKQVYNGPSPRWGFSFQKVYENTSMVITRSLLLVLLILLICMKIIQNIFNTIRQRKFTRFGGIKSHFSNFNYIEAEHFCERNRTLSKQKFIIVGISLFLYLHAGIILSKSLEQAVCAAKFKRRMQTFAKALIAQSYWFMLL